MNPLIQPSSSPLILTLTQLSSHCSRLLNSLETSNVSHRERILYEQTLWNEVKKIRSTDQHSVFLYLIGYYHTILYKLSKSDNCKSDLFEYNVLIRLGDLSRYMSRVHVAEYYYCSARNLFPCFGHAYNQLGILTKPTNFYKCCYYYARAAKSSEKPLNTIADSNLRLAVTKYNCRLLNQVLGYELYQKGEPCKIDGSNVLPKTAIDWFYVIVVAIYADNIVPVSELLLKHVNESSFSLKSSSPEQDVTKTIGSCDRDSYLLLASLDILLTWLKLGSQTWSLLDSMSFEICKIKLSLVSMISTCRVSSTNSANNTLLGSPRSSPNSSARCQLNLNCAHRVSADASESSLIIQNLSPISNIKERDASEIPESRALALPHDYVLKGFAPLDQTHQDLHFNHLAFRKSLEDEIFCEVASQENDMFIQTERYLQLLVRIKNKIDSFGAVFRKQTRNIALESILSRSSKTSRG